MRPHFRVNIFTKIVVIVLLLLIPIVCVYYFSYHTSVSVVESELRESKIKELTFFVNQVDDAIDQTSVYSNVLVGDTDVQRLNSLTNLSLFEANVIKLRVLDKLKLLTASNSWSGHFTVFAGRGRLALTTRGDVFYDEAYLRKKVSPNWRLERLKEGDYFVRHTIYPDPKKLEIGPNLLVVETAFSINNLSKLLNQFKEGGKGDPFLFAPETGDLITNNSANQEMIEALSRHLVQTKWYDDRSSDKFNYVGEDYAVNVIKLDNLDLYLVDYTPLREILLPINKSRNLFYASTGLLLVMSLIAALLLYRNVQIPIKLLLSNVNRLRIGDYSARIDSRMNNEFDLLFVRFNDMSMEIKNLIHKVFLEQIRSREAVLKQLQSQINPHFLYNCLAFIKSMVELGDKHSAVAMCIDLGKYYRYTTHIHDPVSDLKSEVDLIENYLRIQNMKLDRIRYEIRLPEEMLALPIPRLLIQPIVENAIIHGIEPVYGNGIIRITGEESAEGYKIVIEDSGIGMSQEQLRNMEAHLAKPESDVQLGFGTWNTHKRLQYQYGGQSGLVFEPSALGGTKVIMQWSK